MQDRKIITLREGDIVRIRSLRSMLEGINIDTSSFSKTELVRYCRDKVPKAFPPSMHKFIGETAVITRNDYSDFSDSSKVYLKFYNEEINLFSEQYNFSVAMITPKYHKFDKKFKKAFLIKHLNGRVPGSMDII